MSIVYTLTGLAVILTVFMALALAADAFGNFIQRYRDVFRFIMYLIGRIAVAAGVLFVLTLLCIAGYQLGEIMWR